MKNQIGLIGIGLVGTALAENLISAGYPVVGFDIDPDKCLNFAEGLVFAERFGFDLKSRKGVVN